MKNETWFLVETEQDADVGGGIALSPSSVDTQIDSLLISFEDAAAQIEDDMIVPEGISIKNMLLLLEADEEASAQDEEVEEPTVTTDDDVKTTDPAEPLTPKMNLDEFASRVAALIQTYTRRLDVETVIFNRAKNYVVNEHGDDVGRQFEEIMVNEHDIDLRAGGEDDPEPNPQAINAMGPSPA